MRQHSCPEASRHLPLLIALLVVAGCSGGDERDIESEAGSSRIDDDAGADAETPPPQDADAPDGDPVWTSCKPGVACDAAPDVTVLVAEQEGQPVNVAVGPRDDVEAPNGYVVVSDLPAVQIEPGQSPLTESITVTLAVTSIPGANLVVVRISGATLTFLPSTHEDGSLVFQTDQGGLHAVIQSDLSPPSGCPPREVAGGTFDASSIGKLAGATTITGDVAISGDIASLNELRCLVRVAGSLSITTTGLSSLSDLANLRLVDGYLYAAHNEALLNMDDLSSLQAVKAGLGVHDNPLLTSARLASLSLLGHFLYVGGPFSGSLFFSELPKLTSIDLGELSATTSTVSITNSGSLAETPLDLDLGSLRSIDQDLMLSGLDTLEDVAGFRALSTVKGNVTLTNLAALRSVDGLRALKKVKSYLQISSNPALLNVDGLSGLQSVDAGLGVFDNALLTSAALPAVTFLGHYEYVGAPFSGSLYLSKLPKLVRVDLSSLETTTSNLAVTDSSSLALRPLELAFSSLKTVKQDLTLADLATLEDLAGFGALASVDGSVTLSDLAALKNVDGLRALKKVKSYLHVSLNPVLRNVDGLAALESVEAGIGIFDNASLTSAVLPAVTSLGHYKYVGAPFSGSLYLSGLPRLVEVDLRGLETTTSNLAIVNSSSLATGALVLGFAGLTIINGDLTLASLRTLQSLNGYDSITRLTGRLTVSDNPCVTDAQAMTLADRLAPAAVTISANGTGCSL